MATVTARVDENVKKEAETLFKKMGLNMSTAMNLFLKKCILEQGIPFELKIPNEEIEENISSSQISWDFEPHEVREEAYSTYGISKNEKSDELIDKAVSLVKEEVAKEITASKKVEISKEQKKKIADKVAYKIKEDKDLSEVFKENENPFYHWLDNTVEETHQTAKEKFIPIPRLKVTDEGVVEYGFVDFDLDQTCSN